LYTTLAFLRPCGLNSVLYGSQSNAHSAENPGARKMRIDTPTAALSGVEKLNSSHTVKSFRSGKHSLDVFLKRHALKNQAEDSSQTYVVHQDGSVAGYYSLTAGSMERQECPAGVTENMPTAYPIPVIILARLAVDQAYQGRGLGSALLRDALSRIASAADIIGVRAILVHAIDAQAKAFYERFDFEEFPAGALRLMLSLRDLRASLIGGISE
jgi:GNAT superfamily N-acetyltransferase